MTTLTIAINNTSTDQVYPTGTWISVTIGNDYLIFTTSAGLAGASVPSSFTLSSAGVLLNGIQQIVPYYYLAHPGGSPHTYTIPLMGNQNKRYVMAFVFSGATTSEPVLEAWDDSGLTTTNDTTLGAGTPNNSWLRGITTTAGLPGSNWSGSPLAGSASGNFLFLNNQNGALTGVATLYCNLQVVVPATQTAGGAETPVLVCKYTTT